MSDELPIGRSQAQHLHLANIKQQNLILWNQTSDFFDFTRKWRILESSTGSTPPLFSIGFIMWEGSLRTLLFVEITVDSHSYFSNARNWVGVISESKIEFGKQILMLLWSQWILYTKFKVDSIYHLLCWQRSATDTENNSKNTRQDYNLVDFWWILLQLGNEQSTSFCSYLSGIEK